MPTRRISEDENDAWKFLENSCQDPEHDPPMHRVYEPGIWEHECPSCGKKQIFTVPKIIC